MTFYCCLYVLPVNRSLKPSLTHVIDCSSVVSPIQALGPESPNGVIQLRQTRKFPTAVPSKTHSPRTRFETEFRPEGGSEIVSHAREFNGDYQHVDNSDNEV